MAKAAYVPDHFITYSNGDYVTWQADAGKRWPGYWRKLEKGFWLIDGKNPAGPFSTEEKAIHSRKSREQCRQARFWKAQAHLRAYKAEGWSKAQVRTPTWYNNNNNNNKPEDF